MPTWRVCGGQQKGGLLVRRGAGLDSELLADRLSCGAVVEELRLEGLRLQYTLLEGDGPRKGWVSIRVKDVPLLAPESPQAKVELKRKTVASFRPRIFSSADLERKTEMSMSWDPMQKALFYQSRGRWDPSALARLRAPRNTRRVSVVVPTSSGRRKFHPQLWSCFSAQDWPEKELILIESTKAGSRGSSPRARSPDFSSLAAEDERILYVQLEDESLSLGCKRNLGIFLASGDVIVHFDDDDVYGPSYIAEMVSELQRRHLVALTLSAWFDFDLRLQRCGFVDPEALQDVDSVPKKHPKLRALREASVEAAVYGYGFSYARAAKGELGGTDFPLAIQNKLSKDCSCLSCEESLQSH
ncbi:Glyco_trans_2-like domain-containing protein [Durusdinium trenchii]|uniref:Glyco_trans_2-like domain-containing protein n=1 Tax=Durusdinium trenchii TaxID=1381693 RepID=A0ABP0JBP4_9DINO